MLAAVERSSADAWPSSGRSCSAKSPATSDAVEVVRSLVRYNNGSRPRSEKWCPLQWSDTPSIASHDTADGRRVKQMPGSQGVSPRHRRQRRPVRGGSARRSEPHCSAGQGPAPWSAPASALPPAYRRSDGTHVNALIFLVEDNAPVPEPTFRLCSHLQNLADPTSANADCQTT